MKLYRARPLRYPITLNDAHQWHLSGVECPGCKGGSAVGGIAYPCVDLSGLPDVAKLEEPRFEEDFDEFVRLRESIRPLVPPGAPLLPGTSFGPLLGPASGRPGPLCMGFPWMMLALAEGLEALEAEGIRGLKGGPTKLKFRRNPPEGLLELQVEPLARTHRDCLPPDKTIPCADCGRLAVALPDPLLLELASLPTDRDIFRLADLFQVIVVTERFVDAVNRLGFKNLTFLELGVR